MGTSGLVAFVGFTVGMAASQLVAGARPAAAVSSAALVVLYVVTNLGDELGALAALRWLSPFHYANQSRAMVPGQGLDAVATGALVAMSLALLWLASAAFERRDYGAGLWVRRPAGGATEDRAARVPGVLLGSVWTASLRRGSRGLLAWAAGGAAVTATFAAVQPSVMEMWTGLDYAAALVGGGTGIGVEDMYWAFVGEMMAPLIAALVVVRASGWIADLTQGRVEMVLAGPVSWTRLVVGRLVALAVEVLAVTAVSVGTLVVGGLAVGGSLDPVGLARLTAMCVLFGAALGGSAAVLVAWVRRPTAVTVLLTYLAASYLLTFLVAMLEWPAWLDRLSVFWALGHPYLEWPPGSAVAVLLLLAVGGAVLAARVAERTPKVG
jgi:ABC-2 type transport system permease protein